MKDKNVPVPNVPPAPPGREMERILPAAPLFGGNEERIVNRCGSPGYRFNSHPCTLPRGHAGPCTWDS